MSNETAARRYATALADVVGKTDTGNEVRRELKTFADMFATSNELQSAFFNPAVSQKDKFDILENLIKRSNPTKTTANFLRVLLRNNRLSEIGAINNKYESTIIERSGVISATISTSRELSDIEKQDAKKNLDVATGKEIMVVFDIDPKIIGGSITRVGSTVYDGSIKTQLETLKNQMIKSH